MSRVDRKRFRSKLSRPASKTVRLKLEALEDRCLLSAAPLGTFSQQVIINFGWSQTVIEWQYSAPAVVARADDHGNTAAAASPVTLGANDSAAYYGRIGTSGDVDVFRFVAPENGQLTVGQSSVGFRNTLDPHLRAYDASGNLVADGGASLTNSRLSMPIRAGATYYFVAAADSGTIGPYQLGLSATWDSPTGDPPGDTVLTLSADGSGLATGTIDVGGTSDLYSFRATASGEMVVTETASAGNLDPYVYVYDAAGNLVAQNDNDGATANSWVRFDVTAGGVYSVKAAGHGSSAGSYDLQLDTETPSPFHVDFNFTGLSPSDQMIMVHAADRWEDLIVGDLPAVSRQGQTIDDLLIDVTYQSIDGKGGILGQSAPTGLRSGSVLPYRGMIELDSADAQNMTADGSLLDVIVHEMGHVLGLGTIWEQKGLLSGAGTSDPRFLGPNATAAYNAIFHASAGSVPVEAGGGPGTALGHWRESVFGNELMTGWINSGANPLSRITVASMADLGYQVNVAAADPYAPGTSSTQAVRAVSWSPWRGLARDRVFTRLEPQDPVGLGAFAAVGASTPSVASQPAGLRGRLVDEAIAQDWRSGSTADRPAPPAESPSDGQWLGLDSWRRILRDRSRATDSPGHLDPEPMA